MKYELLEFAQWLLENFKAEVDMYYRKSDGKYFNLNEIVKQYLDQY